MVFSNKYTGVPLKIVKESLRITEDGCVVWSKSRPSEHFETISAFKRFKTLFAGKEYGYVSDGYRYGSIRIEGKNKRLLYHVAKWALFYGKYPEGIIDHIDGDGLNNKIENLRDVDRKVNALNSKKMVDNTSGVNGVYWNLKMKKWVAQGYETYDGITVNNYLGGFTTLDEAKDARVTWEKSIGCSERHGK